MKTMCKVVLMGVFLAALALPSYADDAAGTPKPVAKTDAKTRTFEFTYSATVKDLAADKTAKIWIPMPATTEEQKVSIVSKKMPAAEQVGYDKVYNNKILFVQAKANKAGEVPLEITYKVTRAEVKTGSGGILSTKPSPKEKISRFLEPDARVPIGGKPLELIKDRKVPKEQFAAAKLLYDVVNLHMEYRKDKPGWGQGDSVWACDSKFGNCTDFHSLFISLARAQKIPSKFEMGFSVPEKHGDGPVGGYHCWAWFLLNNQGWVPVDISEANRQPKLTEYYFGNLTEDRVQFTTGRDIDLVPRQDAGPLNFFIYPYVEVDGKTYPADKVTRAFSYRDVK